MRPAAASCLETLELGKLATRVVWLEARQRKKIWRSDVLPSGLSHSLLVSMLATVEDYGETDLCVEK